MTLFQNCGKFYRETPGEKSELFSILVQTEDCKLADKCLSDCPMLCGDWRPKQSSGQAGCQETLFVFNQQGPARPGGRIFHLSLSWDGFLQTD